MIIIASEYNQFPASPEKYDVVYRIDENKIFVASVIPEVDDYSDLPTEPGATPTLLNKTYYVKNESKYYVCTQLYPMVWTYIDLSLTWNEKTYAARLPDQYVNRDTLTRVRYLGRDWGTFCDELSAFLVAKYPDYEDFLDSDFGQVLIQLISYAGGTLSWYQDKMASEGFLETAVLRSSVAKIARMTGYTPGRAVGSEMQLTMTVTQAQSSDFTIPQGWQLTVKNLIFEMKNDVKFYAGEMTLRTEEAEKAIVVQGGTVESSFWSDGTKDQRFLLNELSTGKSIAQGSFVVEIAGETWAEVGQWSYEWAKEYRIDYTQSIPVLIFGDGIVSQIPPLGNEIKVLYRVCDGANGNLKTTGQALSQVTPLIIYGVKVPLIMVNVTKGLIGSDEESIEHIRTWSPKLFQTQDRAVTDEDFETLSKSYVHPVYGSAAKVKAMVVKNIDDDPFLRTIIDKIPIAVPVNGGEQNVRQEMEDYLDGLISGGKTVNLVRVYVLQLDEGGDYTDPSSGFVDALEDYLLEKKLATIDVRVSSGYTFLRHATIEAKIKVGDRYDSSSVKTSVEEALNALLTQREFGDNLELADVYTTIMGVIGVDNAYAEIKKRGSETDVTITTEGDMIIADYMMIVKGEQTGEGVIVSLWT